MSYRCSSSRYNSIYIEIYVISLFPSLGITVYIESFMSFRCYPLLCHFVVPPLGITVYIERCMSFRCSFSWYNSIYRELYVISLLPLLV